MTHVTRTVKNGSVTINGIAYYPQNRYVEYDGRLEGKRFLFGLYGDMLWQRAYVYLWGTEEYSKTRTDDAYERMKRLLVVDGAYNWDTWFPSKETLVSMWQQELDLDGKWAIAGEIGSAFNDWSYRNASRVLHEERKETQP